DAVGSASSGSNLAARATGPGSASCAVVVETWARRRDRPTDRRSRGARAGTARREAMMSSDAPPDGRSVDLVAEVYSSDSLAYEKSWAPVLRPHGRRLLERLPLARAARVLDAGAGVGTLLVDIQQEAPAAAVIGVDCSFGMLVRA